MSTYIVLEMLCLRLLVRLIPLQSHSTRLRCDSLYSASSVPLACSLVSHLWFPPLMLLTLRSFLQSNWLPTRRHCSWTSRRILMLLSVLIYFRFKASAQLNLFTQIPASALISNLCSVNFDGKSNILLCSLQSYEHRLPIAVNPVPIPVNITNISARAGVNGTTYATFSQPFNNLCTTYGWSV